MHVARHDRRVNEFLLLTNECIGFFQGEAIKRITCVEHDSSGKPICVNDRQSMVQAARGLLSAVTRVLLLADMVVVKQIIHIKKKVRFVLEMKMETKRIVL